MSEPLSKELRAAFESSKWFANMVIEAEQPKTAAAVNHAYRTPERLAKWTDMAETLEGAVEALRAKLAEAEKARGAAASEARMWKVAAEHATKCSMNALAREAKVQQNLDGIESAILAWWDALRAVNTAEDEESAADFMADVSEADSVLRAIGQQLEGERAARSALAGGGEEKG